LIPGRVVRLVAMTAQLLAAEPEVVVGHAKAARAPVSQERAGTPPTGLPAGRVLQLQTAAGNAAVARFLGMQRGPVVSPMVAQRCGPSGCDGACDEAPDSEKPAAQRAVQRTLGPNSTCPPSTAGAPANPLPVISAANDRAVIMALGAAGVLFVESMLIQTPGNTLTSAFGAYRHRFGTPPAVGAKFRNRFSGALLPTLVRAQAAEMEFLSRRLNRIGTFLSGPIRFRCTGTSHTKIGNCTHHCSGSTVLASCASGHGRTMAVCQPFWTTGAPDQQAIGMIHEVGHMILHFGDHDASFAHSFGQRATEPECYASLVADIYGVTPFDPSCPTI
jgi:hypothetical protein